VISVEDTCYASSVHRNIHPVRENVGIISLLFSSFICLLLFLAFFSLLYFKVNDGTVSGYCHGIGNNKLIINRTPILCIHNLAKHPCSPAL
jgi:hypothetical protein